MIGKREERLFHNLEARTMDEGQPQVLLERLMGKFRDSPSATLRVGPGCARYEETPAQDSGAEAAEERWERVSRGECDVSQGRPALETPNLTLAAPEAGPDGDAGPSHPTERGEAPNPISEGIGFQGSGLSEPTPDPRPLIPGFSCETNPIRSDALAG